MRNKWIFSEKTDLDVLKKWIEIEDSRRGYKAALARAAQCQPAYLSQILGGRANLTADQAAGLCDYWSLDELEAEYFLTLNELSRAATPSLRHRLERKIEAQRRQSIEKRGRLEPEPRNPEKILNYYLDWAVSAIHLLLSVPGYDEPKIIAKKLGVEESRVVKSLAVLRELGMAENKGNRWNETSRLLHASNENLFAALHHRNWRARSNEIILSDKTKNNLNFTSIHSLSKEDFLKIRKMTQEYIENSRRIIIKSKEEMLGGLIIDWFEI